MGAAGHALAFSRAVGSRPSRRACRSLQLDHVFVTRAWQPLGLEVPRGRIWGQMSDHLPLIADFDMPLIAP